MKKRILSAVFLCSVAASSLSAQITITRSGFNFTAGDYPINQLTGQNITINAGGNQSWGSNPVTGGFPAPVILSYQASAGPDFPGALLLRVFNNLSPTYGVYVKEAVQIGDDGVKVVGTLMDEQHYGLGQLTGNPADSLIFPQQKVTTTGFRYVIKFPATAGGAWSSSMHYIYNGQLTAAAFGLNKAPMAKSGTAAYVDSVYGWGKARIPASDGRLSDWNDVICVKRTVVSVDSLFLNGAPAPALLLGALGAQQGMVTREHRYLFWRANLVSLINIYFGADSTFSKNATVSFDGQVPAGTSAVHDQPTAGHAAAYPNPATGQVTVPYATKHDGMTVIEFVTSSGAVVQKIPVYSPAGDQQVPVSVQNLASGAYRYIVRDSQDNIIANGSITVVR